MGKYEYFKSATGQAAHQAGAYPTKYCYSPPPPLPPSPAPLDGMLVELSIGGLRPSIKCAGTHLYALWE